MRYRQRRQCRLSRLERLENRVLLAVDFPLTNGSFESPSLSPSNSWHSTVDGWAVSGNVGTTFEIPTASPSPASDGDQYVYGDSDQWTLIQPGPQLTANTRYFMTVDLFPLTTDATRVDLTIEDATTPAILGQSSYRPIWDSDREDFELPQGTWTTVTVAFNTAADPTTVGHETWLRIDGARLAIDNVKLSIDDTVHDFHISSSAGNPANSGFSSAEAWQDFERLSQYLPLLPGEKVLLKAGDLFSDELNLRGKGTATEPIELGKYGTGPNPIIRRSDLKHDVGVLWNNASFVNIRHIDVEHAKLGIYLRYEYTDFGSRDVLIEHSNFRDLSDPTLEPSLNNFEYAWSDAIWVGGQAWGAAEFSTRLENLTIRHVTSENAAHLFGTGWYFPDIYKSRVKNLLIEDSVAYNNFAGSFQLFGVDGGIIRRVHAIGGGGVDTWSGTTLGFIQDSKNVLIEDSEFAYIDRAQSADGSGMDFEGNTENVTFRGNTIHGNAGSAILILETNGPHTNLVIEDNVLYDNARDPWNSEINSEIQGSSGSTGRIVNNGIYRGDASINFLAPNSDWSGFEVSGNRFLEYDDVQLRPNQWNFDEENDFEDWTGFNQWADASVSEGVLSGISTGNDPYAISPATWVNTTEKPYAWIRMSQSAGSMAQLFWITETDRTWDASKSVFFPITSDGQYHDYFVDLDQAGAEGVIVGLRIDPVIVSGATMSIDFIRMTDQTDPNQTPPDPPEPDPLELVFAADAARDGYVRESSQNSGVGGTVFGGESTFRIGDDSLNRAYRPVLSFDTSALPDNAIVVEATLGITRVGDITGAIPIGVAESEFGDILVDLSTPALGNDVNLEASDWQAVATQDAVSKFAWPAYSNGMTIYSRLDDQHADLINLSGTTQFRIRYQNDDDGDSQADYVRYASSDHSDVSIRPRLTIKYRLPPVVAPRITDIIMASSEWNSDFIDQVDGGGSGEGNRLGISLKGSDQLRSLPWVSGIDRIYLQFDRPVGNSFLGDNLSLLGSNGLDYSPITDIDYGIDGVDVGSIRLSSAITNDTLLLTVFDTLVSDEGVSLDGEWTDSESEISGNGTEGGQFNFRFDVLVGDVDDSGVVNFGGDLFAVYAKVGVTSISLQDAYFDITHDGAVNFGGDMFAVYAIAGSALPPTPPLPPTSAGTYLIDRALRIDSDEEPFVQLGDMLLDVKLF